MNECMHLWLLVQCTYTSKQFKNGKIGDDDNEKRRKSLPIDEEQVLPQHLLRRGHDRNENLSRHVRQPYVLEI